MGYEANFINDVLHFAHNTGEWNLGICPDLQLEYCMGCTCTFPAFQAAKKSIYLYGGEGGGGGAGYRTTNESGIIQ